MKTNLPLDIDVRLARLEKTARRGRIVAALGIAAAFLLGAARPGVSGPEGTALPAPFSVVDASGKTLFWIGRDSERRITMDLMDDGGKVVARVQPRFGLSGRLTLYENGRAIHYPR